VLDADEERGAVSDEARNPERAAERRAELLILVFSSAIKMLKLLLIR